ncbi:TIGR03089 family protein [Corynebacterium propinquum]|uniref:TIGR03089 family protein n=1 Tax=Corynebacterium propinquum TaxID=43769 RepID=UPI0003710F1D|nr:TIGR03089 family protein [Corynebacterium propinquum]MDK4234645.1 TIGR03089 family protein [Corynebacterium propinquum]MDK4292633.1 TIGR03089 family protein [Corynebacterium propinquum]MDK4320319.1 TIGR03089 family protein [Corynebacterium propinquum]PZQ27580.1 MAG: TIGR03089 family protein [Corynebacterium propinquum]QQU90288.1 TIGR03089 family protein [Corynebacterium propinquum]
MDMLSHLLADDPASPRLTVYNEADGTRMDFSAQTTENWASKVANFLREELDLDDGSVILVDLPVSWQTVMISLGALAAGVTVHFATDTVATADSSDTADAAEPVVFFTTTDKASEYANRGDVVVVTTDPFGRGVEELGQQVPEGAIDFGPTVRFYGDFYPGQTRPLAELIEAAVEPHAERLLSTGWTDSSSFQRQVLSPLAAGGSAVVVAGMVDTERLAEIAENEKVTARD